jgi:hypothetical protein
MANHIKPIAVIHCVALLIFGFLYSCKTPERIPEVRLKPMNAVKLYKKAKDNTFDYSQFNIRKVNIQYDNGRNKTSLRASVTALKDQAVIVSITKLNILLARVKLSPDSITYINYFDKSYFKGLYEPVCNLLNFDLDFNTIQAIVSANIFSLFENQKDLREYKTWTESGMYVLQSETIRKLSRMEARGRTHRMERFLKRKNEEISVIQTFYFDPSLYVIRKLTMEDKNSPRKVTLQFSDYEPVGTKFFPASVGMVFQSDSVNLEVQAKMSGFSIEEGEIIPFKIPERYERIFLK